MLVIINIVFLWFCVTGNNALKRPNFLLVLTDDQDLLLSGLLPMEKTRKLIANQSQILTNFFVNTPICCPSRSTILTGKYAHTLRVFNNSLNGNCNNNIVEPNSIGALLKTADYITFYAGKYLNTYESKGKPKGWDWWYALKGNSRYYNYELNINGTYEEFPNRTKYLTDHLWEFSLDFLQKKPTDQPFLMIVAPPAPHAPFTPPPRYINKFREQKAVRNPAFNYSTTDKHWLVQMSPKIMSTNLTQRLDDIQRDRLRTLLAVDDLLANLIEKLTEIREFSDTYVIFTSDNGFHIGQFTQPWDKRQPYESDIRVPFIISGPNIPMKTLNYYPSSTVDLVPTILDLAGLTKIRDFDGTSIKRHLFKPPTNYSQFVLIEYWGESNKSLDRDYCPYDPGLSQCSRDNHCKCEDAANNTYSCLRHISLRDDFKYCEFSGFFFEAYDLNQDPYELLNVYKIVKKSDITKYKTVLDVLKRCEGVNCHLENFNAHAP